MATHIQTGGTAGTIVRLADMETHSLRLYLAAALKDAEIRRACSAVEAILHAGSVLDELSPTALEQVRDYCTDYNKGRHGPFSDFKRKYIELVIDHLNDARFHERRLFRGVTGKEDKHDKW